MTWVTSMLIEVTQEVWEHREEKGGKLLLGRGVEKSLCLCWPHLLGVSLAFSTFSCVWRATGHKSSEPIQSAISYRASQKSSPSYLSCLASPCSASFYQMKPHSQPPLPIPTTSKQQFLVVGSQGYCLSSTKILDHFPRSDDDASCSW